MAVNPAAPHLYDGEYFPAALPREIRLFNRPQHSTYTYVDASGATVTRVKGYEDTNLTDDGRVIECDIELQSLTLAITPGDDFTSVNHARDIYAFLERGYVEFQMDDSKTLFTSRIKDLVPNEGLDLSGYSTNASTHGATLRHVGRPYAVPGIVIPAGRRFGMFIRFERQVTLPSGKACRIAAEIIGKQQTGAGRIATASAPVRVAPPRPALPARR